ncbi:MAG: LegC family aminotransferase [Bdellovibrionales bacterium]|nr:LegC family aminotransferase [Bdellovibrionales bacterium]
MKYIPLSVPHITGNAKQYITSCIDTEWVSTAGSYVGDFEKALTRYTGSQHAVAVHSGTSALHLALIALGIGPGDEVIAPTLTFIATVNAIHYTGASPVLIDVDRKTWNLNPDAVRDFLQNSCTVKQGRVVNNSSGKTVKALLPVHILGESAEITELLAIADEYGIEVIEDAAEATGSKSSGKHLGTFGRAGILSFNGNKIITSGSGGALLTNDSALAQKVRHLSTQAKLDPVAFIHDEVGFNYRMSNMHAALGLSQLEAIEDFVLKKRQIRERYLTAFERHLTSGTLETQGTRSNSESESNCWLNAFILPNAGKPLHDHSEWKPAVEHMKHNNIECRPLWAPMHSLAPYSNVQVYPSGRVAEELCRRTICLPSSVGLTENDQLRVIDCLDAYLKLS